MSLDGSSYINNNSSISNHSQYSNSNSNNSSNNNNNNNSNSNSNNSNSTALFFSLQIYLTILRSRQPYLLMVLTSTPGALSLSFWRSPLGYGRSSLASLRILSWEHKWSSRVSCTPLSGHIQFLYGTCRRRSSSASDLFTQVLHQPKLHGIIERGIHGKGYDNSE
ncbi:hypothetical protein CLOM_g22246 [Closterium sp. NIES-68]|nr:hypothetical protein CLOM_g22246 [Closterium sp. NIES-68]